jgi:hypothetical protein
MPRNDTHCGGVARAKPSIVPGMDDPAHAPTAPMVNGSERTFVGQSTNPARRWNATIFDLIFFCNLLLKNRIRDSLLDSLDPGAPRAKAGGRSQCDFYDAELQKAKASASLVTARKGGTIWGQLIDKPRFQGRKWIWISFSPALISFSLGLDFLQPGLEFLQPGLDFLQCSLEFVLGGPGRADFWRGGRLRALRLRAAGAIGPPRRRSGPRFGSSNGAATRLAPSPSRAGARRQGRRDRARAPDGQAQDRWGRG